MIIKRLITQIVDTDEIDRELKILKEQAASIKTLEYPKNASADLMQAVDMFNADRAAQQHTIIQRIKEKENYLSKLTS